MKTYESLFRHYKDQPLEKVFAHFYPTTIGPDKDYDEPFKAIARATGDGIDAWGFRQQRFKDKHKGTAVPKLKNYLNYTFVRLLELEQKHPGEYFAQSSDEKRIAFNTGLQTPHGADLLATFERYRPQSTPPNTVAKVVPDWVFKGCYAPSDHGYRNHFGTKITDIASYSSDSRDFVFDVSYNLDRDVFDHL